VYEDFEIPVGIKIPYSRGERDGFFAQTNSVIERSKYNLMMLLMTAKGERPMMPEYGSNLREILFDPNINEYIDKVFYDEVKETTEVWMPEIIVDSVDVETDYDNQPHRVDLKITYSLANIPDTENELSLTIDAG